MIASKHVRAAILARARYYFLASSLIQRRFSAPWRVLPDVFILGATKSGSTTLTHMLWQHPAHVSPFTKELMYLQHLPNFRSNWEFSRLSAYLWGRYREGHAKYCVSGYRKFFPTRWAMQRRRQRVGAAMTSDCDPFNLYCEIATRRIAALCRDARFIVCLRNPVLRAFSDFNMHHTFVGEQRTFAEAIDAELSGRESRFRQCFLHQSVYVPHLERWFAAFPRERFFVVRAEDLFSDSAAVARQMFSFLGLEPVTVDCTAQNRGTYSGEIDCANENRLRDYFRPFNMRLYELLDRDMGWEAMSCSPVHQPLASLQPATFRG